MGKNDFGVLYDTKFEAGEIEFTAEWIHQAREELSAFEKHFQLKNGKKIKTLTGICIEFLDEIERLQGQVKCLEFERDHRDEHIEKLEKEIERKENLFLNGQSLYQREHPEGMQEIIDLLNTGAEKYEGGAF